MKKTLTVLIALFCIAGIAFAGGKKEKPKTGDDLSKHVVITYMTTGDKPTNGATEKMLEKLKHWKLQRLQGSMVCPCFKNPTGN